MPLIQSNTNASTWGLRFHDIAGETITVTVIGMQVRLNKEGTRLFITLNQAGKVVMFDIADPARPKVLRILDLGSGSGPHYLRLTENERRLVISDYFLNEDSLGKVRAEGDHIVHVARVEHNNLELDPRFEVNFNTAFQTGPARPHGLAFK